MVCDLETKVTTKAEFKHLMHWQKGKNMKISNYMDNANLIMKTNANKIQKENNQTRKNINGWCKNKD